MYKKWIKPKNNLAIEIQNLNKTYKSSSKNIKALSNVNLNIKCGSFYGLLGPNGAGKSTIINILGGTVTKDKGDLKIWGLNIDTHRKQSKLAIGIVPQELNIDAFFTPKDQLELQAGLFNVPKKLSGNDVGSLEHVLQRRLKYYDDPKTKPNLILIDGGKAQLKFVNKVVNDSDHGGVNVISIVKGANRIRATETIISQNGIIELDKYSNAFLLLQEIRDAAHRFALKAQRSKKRRVINKSELDNVKGIGDVLKTRLLKKFKSIKSIKKASIEDLMTVPGINEKIVENIKKLKK